MMQMSNGWHQQEGDPGEGRGGELGVRETVSKFSCPRLAFLFSTLRGMAARIFYLSCRNLHCVITVSGTFTVSIRCRPFAYFCIDDQN